MLLGNKQMMKNSSGGGGAWDLSSAVFNGDVAINKASGVFFKDDGTKMYTTRWDSGTFYELNLSTAWDATAYSSYQSYNASAQTTSNYGMFFSPDGLNFYLMSTSGSLQDSLLQYSLSTAWDITTLSYVRRMNLGTIISEYNPRGIYFIDDGLTLFLSGDSTDKIHEFSLSTAWDISTYSLVQSFDVSAFSSRPSGLYFNPNGLQAYLIDSLSDDIYELNMSTAWNISTISLNYTFDLRSLGGSPTPHGLYIRSDGLKLYVADSNKNKVQEFDLTV
tara:strand:- start:1136 stop:1963 length:828 start_codon:yes stop_codon:yes gene_type:complete